MEAGAKRRHPQKVKAHARFELASLEERQLVSKSNVLTPRLMGRMACENQSARTEDVEAVANWNL